MAPEKKVINQGKRGDEFTFAKRSRGRKEGGERPVEGGQTSDLFKVQVDGCAGESGERVKIFRREEKRSGGGRTPKQR